MQFRLYLIFAKPDNFAVDYSVYTKLEYKETLPDC